MKNRAFPRHPKHTALYQLSYQGNSGNSVGVQKYNTRHEKVGGGAVFCAGGTQYIPLMGEILRVYRCHKEH